MKPKIELQELLGYADWRNFLNAINKAKESCKTSGEAVSDHFVDSTNGQNGLQCSTQPGRYHAHKLERKVKTLD